MLWAIVGMYLIAVPKILDFYGVRLSQHNLDFLCIWLLVISMNSSRWSCWLVTLINLPKSLPRSHWLDKREPLQFLLLWAESHSWVLNFVYLIDRKRTFSMEIFINADSQNVPYGTGIIAKRRPIMILHLFPGKSQLGELL